MAGLKCRHGYDYPAEGPDGPHLCNPDGSNPNCPDCSPDAWAETVYTATESKKATH